MRIADRIGEPFPSGGCTAFACAVASEFHGQTIADPLTDERYMAAMVNGEASDIDIVSGCARTNPPLQVGDLVIWGVGDRHQHMGVVAENSQVLHAQRSGGSRLTPLVRILPYILSAWRPVMESAGW